MTRLKITNTSSFYLLPAVVILLALFSFTDPPNGNDTPEGCPDLEITEIKIIEQRRKCILLEYSITNIGDGTLNLGGKSAAINDNLAIQAHFSGDRRLNKGDVLADGDFLGHRGKTELAPDQTITANFKVSLRSKTNHVGVLILKADATHIAKECDETNNTNFVILEW